MLVITRRLDEGIVIDGDIEVIVLGIEDGRVKLGIEAPKEKKIYRDEIYKEIKKENQEAQNINQEDLFFLQNIKKSN